MGYAHCGEEWECFTVEDQYTSQMFGSELRVEGTWEIKEGSLYA